jgi:predicted DsbA family dithiol-disulfide isomerase
VNKTKIKVDVVSDVVCPWCFIGKRRLEAAIRSLPENLEVEVRHLPFELNPDLPSGGTDQKEYLRNKFGGDDRYQQITARVTSVAEAEGLRFDFSKQAVLPNTLDSHRLIQFAAEAGVQGKVVEGLMKAYFEDGKDLSDRDTLLDIASDAGVDRQAAGKLLDSNEDVQSIRNMENLNHERGISGVPFFIIDNKYGVSGAQPSETLVQIFTEVASEISAKGETCEVDDPNC